MFICILCTRKHHCQVHHISTNTLMMDQELKTNYNPVSDYKATFHPIKDAVRTKRGLAIPARILCNLNSDEPMDNLTMTRKDFVPKPLVDAKVPPKARATIPGISTTPFQDDTSYKLDYPKRKMAPNPISQTLMRTTLPKIVEVGPEDVYCTTNQLSLQQWQGKCRSDSYKELQERPFFTGMLETESTTKKDFKTLENARRSKSCKKVEVHESAGEFDESTTHNAAYKLPPIAKKRVVFAKGNSQRQAETMEPYQEESEFVTQYQRDTSDVPEHPIRRGYCQPEQDKLNLFHGNFDHKTVHKSTYNKFDGLRLSKQPHKTANDVSSTNPMKREGEIFCDETTTNSHFQPISKSVRARGMNEAREVNFKISQENKGSSNIKKSQNFGIGKDVKTVNQSEYFKFHKTPRREFHGDKAERLYFPSSSKFDTQSETKDSFVTKIGKRAEPFKPLDRRFQKKVPLYSKKMASETSYKSDFVPLPLPIPEMCPAEQLIKQA